MSEIITRKFEELKGLNVNDKVEKRTDGQNELSYLSWSFAWAEFKKVYPTATYRIMKFPQPDGTLVPYMFDKNTGYMVNTVINADGIEYEMWLPVMNSTNKAMRDVAYSYKTKYGEKTVEPASMFDVNKAIMRCLVKNMAMFGLGLYIYAGEDLPDKVAKNSEDVIKEEITSIEDAINNCKTDAELKELYKKNKAQITSNKKLLDLITTVGSKLKKDVA